MTTLAKRLNIYRISSRCQVGHDSEARDVQQMRRGFICYYYVSHLNITIVCYLQLQKKTKGNDDEFDIGDVSDVQPRARSGRAKTAAKYTFDSEDDEDMD